MSERLCTIKYKDCPDTIRLDCKRVHRPKPYLNQQEQKILWCMGAAESSFEDMIREIKHRRNDIENQRLLKHLELALKHTEKAVEILCGDLPMADYVKFVERLKRRNIIVEG